MSSFKVRSAILVIFLTVLAPLAVADVVLTENGQPMAVILTPPGPSTIHTKAAQEFQLHIQKMSGATLPISTVGLEGDYPGYNQVYVGDSSATRDAGINVLSMTNEFFTIRTISTHALCIVGKDGGSSDWTRLSDSYPGTMFGVYYVLGEELGVRWLWPGDLGIYAPQVATVTVPDLDVVDGPMMVQRHFRIPRIGKCYLNGSSTYTGSSSLAVPILPADQPSRDALALDEYHWLRRQRMGTRFDPPLSHYFEEWWGKYGASGTISQHPEWFAFPPPGNNPPSAPPGGGTDAMKQNVSHPGVWAQLVAEFPGSRIKACPTDSKYHCTCPDCLAWDSPTQTPDQVWNSSGAILGDRYAKFYNAIADLAGPTKTVYGYAYDVYKNAPFETTVRSNVALAYIPGAPSDTDLDSIQETQHNVLGWIAAGCGNMYLRPNWFLSAHCGPYWPLTRVGNHFVDMTADGKFVGFDSDSSNSSYACMGPYLYLISRLLADPTLTVDEIKEEYCSAFGSAAPKVMEYLDYWESFIYDEVDGGNITIVAWADCVDVYDESYVPSVFDTADIILNQAHSMLGPGETDAAARLEFLKAGVTHGRLTSEAISLVNPSLPITMNPAAEGKFRELLAFRDANADKWTLWREWFIDREAQNVLPLEGRPMAGYWSYILDHPEGGTSTAGAFIETGGMVAMEAEHYTGIAQGTGSFSAWEWEENPDTTSVNLTGVSGTSMWTMPNPGTNADVATSAPRLDFKIDFSTTGIYYALVRMPIPLSGGDDSVNVGMDGLLSYNNVRNSTGRFSWRPNTDRGDILEFPVTRPGVFSFSIWMREDGTLVDKIVLSTNSQYVLAGTDTGPAESDKRSDVEYALTVVNGIGGGNYGEGSLVHISPDPPDFGKEFDQWIGDTDTVADVFAPNTTLIMPAAATAVEATYKDAPVYYVLTVGSGTGDGNYLENDEVNISAYPAPAGRQFDQWTDDVAYVTNVNSADTQVTMPAGNVTVTATYVNLPGYYDLTVVNGAGSGIYLFGTQVYIAANAPPAGQTFAGWTGDTVYVDDPSSASAILTMPMADATVTATYLSVYTLTVNYGTGDGTYQPGDEVAIAADPAPLGKVFASWEGDTQYVADPSSASTTVTMPAANTTVTAIYNPAAPTYMLMVTKGHGGGAYPPAAVVPINADAPPLGQQFRRWTGDTAYVENVTLADTMVTMPAADVSVTAFFAFPSQTTYTLTVNSGTGDGDYEEGDVRPIVADTAPPGQMFDKWTGDTDSVANVNTSTTNVTMPAANVTVTATYVPSGVDTYLLTVNSGAGDGSYEESMVVAIEADAPPTGKIFDQWTGDTAYVADVSSSSTSVTMPAAAVTVTATYVDEVVVVLYALTVNSGTGDGEYEEGDVVQIVADAPPAGMEFNGWTGDTAFLADPNASTTNVTMPDGDVTVTATYENSLIQVVFPSSDGITFERGGRAYIAWAAPDLDRNTRLRIELTNGADTWVLTEKAKAGKSPFKWDVGKWKSKTGQPVYPDGDSYRIRISTLDDSADDSSDNPFAIGAVIGLEIDGPTEVNEDSFAQYTCMALFNFGAPQDYSNAKIKWRSSSKAAKAKKRGLLFTKSVTLDEACTITASYGKKESYVEDTFNLTIKNQ
jgi:uncharacterized repeat protein (TIGR02543 family)